MSEFIIGNDFRKYFINRKIKNISEVITTSEVKVLNILAKEAFTCNCIAWNVESDKVIDPYDGITDFKHRCIMFQGNNSYPKHDMDNARMWICKDPIIIISAARIIAEINGNLEHYTLRGLQKYAYLVKEIPYTEMKKEMQKGLHLPRFLEILREIGALQYICSDLNALY